MPRRLKLKTSELGILELQLIYDVGGVWEEEWRPLQGAELAGLFTYVSKADMDHALHGLTWPLVSALGLGPKYVLLKFPKVSQQCASRGVCPFYDRTKCFPRAKALPWCFEPEGVEDKEARILAGSAIKLWREGVYIVVVREEAK